jgi:hypothetical protein
LFRNEPEIPNGSVLIAVATKAMRRPVSFLLESSEEMLKAYEEEDKARDDRRDALRSKFGLPKIK